MSAIGPHQLTCDIDLVGGLLETRLCAQMQARPWPLGMGDGALLGRSR